MKARALVVFVTAGAMLAIAAPGQQRKKNSFKSESIAAYNNWVNTDVGYIITPEERTLFKSLTNDEARDTFVEQFWLRRDPTPDTSENEFKEEHYRRIAYSNIHFATSQPGWKSDRGHIYIVYGPPLKITKLQEDGHDAEIWSYRVVGPHLSVNNLLFVDECKCGDYALKTNRDTLLKTPPLGAFYGEVAK